MESFEEIYQKELQIQREIESIEATAAKLKEKYKDYAELGSFVDYLKATEEVFLRAKVYQWGKTQVEDELLKSEIYLMSIGSKLDREVFDSIHSDFKATHYDINKIYKVAESLESKYGIDNECKVFVKYMRDIMVLFSQGRTKDTEFLRDGLLKAKIKFLSADGIPEETLLEKIYQEFKENLSQNK